VLSADDCLAIRALHVAWLRAELRGDSSALLQLCTPVPVWLPPNEPPLCGKTAILGWLEDQSQTTVRRIEVANLQIFGVGSFACKFASFRTMIESPECDGGALVIGTHAWLLQRDRTGAWRIGFVTWTIDADARKR
jgi:ketosteroid isomerase-like protein